MKDKQKLTDAEIIALAKAGNDLELLRAGEKYQTPYERYGDGGTALCPVCSKKNDFFDFGPVVCASSSCKTRFVVIYTGNWAF